MRVLLTDGSGGPYGPGSHNAQLLTWENTYNFVQNSIIVGYPVKTETKCTGCSERVQDFEIG